MYNISVCQTHFFKQFKHNWIIVLIYSFYTEDLLHNVCWRDETTV